MPSRRHSSAMLSSPRRPRQDDPDLLFSRVMLPRLPFNAPDQLVSGILRCSGFLVHLRSIMASMNQKSSVVQTPKFVRWALTSDNLDTVWLQPFPEPGNINFDRSFAGLCTRTVNKTQQRILGDQPSYVVDQTLKHGQLFARDIQRFPRGPQSTAGSFELDLADGVGRGGYFSSTNQSRNSGQKLCYFKGLPT